ncbi:DUF523 domain-containing protein [Thermococcus gammatolerans]|uniref:DUF523 domain-containing protein n=1 Tax=Thermococcus gammatolerans (strain DSM 15229 / JCM 11827 / EJ3) TaxID=593117 RepID=C5A2H7_THEGJ|nr:DUF523 domain-containing protein [Thermococcus gammatolerans]ACS34596.1 Conserved hypothetical protein [Thermococcus gammatolerans EJ3]
MNLLIIAPCLLSPFYVYRGPKEKEYMTARELRKLVGELGDEWHVLAYPCPEFELIGWPRPPMGRESFERLGMRERVQVVADFIGRVLTEEKPERVVFVGVKGSPTCGVFHTTSNDPDSFDYGLIPAFFYMDKGKRLDESRKVVEKFGFEVKTGPGLLFEELMERFPEAEFMEFDKDDIEGSTERLRRAIMG